MAGVFERSSCLKAQRRAAFSIKRTEKKAIQVAEAIREHLPTDLLHDENCAVFLSYMSDVCHVPHYRSMQLLTNFMPLRVNRFNMYRLALAIMQYLPVFNNHDDMVDHTFTGDPAMWAHVRVLEAYCKETSNGKFTVYIDVLFLTTLLAGQVKTFSFPYLRIRKVFRALGLRDRIRDTDALLPQELTSMYGHILVGKNNTDSCALLAYDITNDERKRNKQLVSLRKNKMCGVNVPCTECLRGKDSCALACRVKGLVKVDANDSKAVAINGSFDQSGV